MTKQEDALKFLEMLLEDCTGASDHSWRRCRRCMAMSRLENRDPFALGLLTEAIEMIGGELGVKRCVQKEPEEL